MAYFSTNQTYCSFSINELSFDLQSVPRVDFDGDEWRIVSKTVSAVDRASLYSFSFADNSMVRKSLLQITVNLKRNSVLIEYLFLTPLHGKSIHVAICQKNEGSCDISIVLQGHFCWF